MRTALITGGAGGIGRATADKFLSDGLRVIIADLDQGAVEKAVAEIDNAYCHGLQLDVTSEAENERLFAHIEAEWGPVSVLAHFAGIVGGRQATAPALADMPVDDWEAVFRVNARGTFLAVREMARWRRAAPVDHGRIITMTSLAGQMGGLQTGSAYAASKAAVIGFSRNAARDLAPLGITVNAISPGPIDTPMLAAATGAQASGAKYSRVDAIPLKRVGAPREIAAAASFLASVDAGYITGAVIDVNGGLGMH